MGQYKANSTNSQNFTLTLDEKKIGELIYNKWYSFKAEILMADGKKYNLVPQGFWDSKIELIDDGKILLEFKMGWKGIIIQTFFRNQEDTFLLKLNGLLSSKFVLLDTEKKELMAAEALLKWKKLNYDYNIATTQQFDQFENKELLLLTILHCINYYITIIAAGA